MARPNATSSLTIAAFRDVSGTSEYFIEPSGVTLLRRDRNGVPVELAKRVPLLVFLDLASEAQHGATEYVSPYRDCGVGGYNGA